MIERYKRVDAKTLELDMTIDDPGAYTKPFYSYRNSLLPRCRLCRTHGFVRHGKSSTAKAH